MGSVKSEYSVDIHESFFVVKKLILEHDHAKLKACQITLYT